MAPRKQTDVATEELKQSERAGDTQSIVDGAKQPKELVDDFAITTDAFELERFMNDVLEIYVAPSDNPEVNPIDLPNVNGINQLVPLGETIKIKRKFVEVMARTRTTVYDQVTPDPSQPERKIMKEKTIVTRPFTVTNDPAGEKGALWLQGILKEQ